MNNIYSSGTNTAIATGAAPTAPNMPTAHGSQQFSKEVEDEANSYFQRIYNTTGSSSAMTIDQIIEILKNLRDSPHDKDKV